MLSLDEKKNLSKLRLEHANKCLNSAKLLVEADDFASAANLSYYAVFHAMRAVLAFDGIDMKKHSAIIAEFRRLYIKTGKFELELSKIITNLFDTRNDSDYDDFFVIDKCKVKEQIANAELFVAKITEFLFSN